jgi:uncharacterized protein
MFGFFVPSFCVACSPALDRKPQIANDGKTMTSIAMPYCELPVTDLDRAIEFYKKVLGVDFTRETIDGYEMALFPPAVDGQGASGALAKGDVYVPTRNGVIIYFSVTDIDDVLTNARGQGAEIL